MDRVLHGASEENLGRAGRQIVAFRSGEWVRLMRVRIAWARDCRTELKASLPLRERVGERGLRHSYQAHRSATARGRSLSSSRTNLNVPCATLVSASPLRSRPIASAVMVSEVVPVAAIAQ